ncbi:hypothetical protein H0X06_01610 [Candidatus Dependentiae bacterium]|nr:hypothetical protein [Candidatus Dependentiae bacterium]
MNKKSLRAAGLLSLCAVGAVMGMQMESVDKSIMKLSSDVEKVLPQDLQKYVASLEEQIVLSHDAITFLGLHPLVISGLEGDDNQRDFIVALKDDKLVIKFDYSEMQIWDVRTRKCMYSINSPSSSRGQLVVHNDTVVCGGANSTVEIWDMKTGERLREFTMQKVSNFEISSDKIALWAKGEASGLIKIFDIRTGQSLYDFDHKNLSSIALSGDKLISGSYDGSIKLWDMHTGKLIDELERTEQVLAVAITHDKLAIGSLDAITRLWSVKIGDIKTGESITLGGDNGHFGSIESITIKGDKILTKACGDPIRIWNIYTGELVLEFCSGFNLGEISKDYAIMSDVLSGATEIWDIHTRKLLRTSAESTNTYRHLAVQGDKVVIMPRVYRPTYIAKILPLVVDIKGTSEENPCRWIVKMADNVQLSFIQCAYEATSAGKDFIIDLPEKLGIIKKNETQEQVNGRIYFTFPEHVRAYLRNRLNIRRPANWSEKFSSVSNCLIQ